MTRSSASPRSVFHLVIGQNAWKTQPIQSWTPVTETRQSPSPTGIAPSPYRLSIAVSLAPIVEKYPWCAEHTISNPLDEDANRLKQCAFAWGLWFGNPAWHAIRQNIVPSRFTDTTEIVWFLVKLYNRISAPLTILWIQLLSSSLTMLLMSNLPEWRLIFQACLALLVVGCARFSFKLYGIRRKFQLMQKNGLVSPRRYCHHASSIRCQAETNELHSQCLNITLSLDICN